MNDRQFIALLVNERAFNKLSMAHIAIKIEKLKKFIIIEQTDEVKKAVEIINNLDEKELDKCIFKLINCIKNKQYIESLAKRNICRIGYKVIEPVEIVRFYINLDFYSVECINNILIVNIKFYEGKTKTLYLKQLVLDKSDKIKLHCHKLGYKVNKININFINFNGDMIDESLYDVNGNKINVLEINDVLNAIDKLKLTYHNFREFFINDIVRLDEESIENDEQYLLREDKRIEEVIAATVNRLNSDISHKACSEEIKLITNEINKIKIFHKELMDVPF